METIVPAVAAKAFRIGRRFFPIFGSKIIASRGCSNFLKMFPEVRKRFVANAIFVAEKFFFVIYTYLLPSCW